MTVASSTDRATFPGNGAATVFSLPFRFFANSEIQAWLVTNATGALTALTLGTHYTLIGAGDPEVDGNPTSKLTMVTAPTSLQSLFVQRVVPVTQPTDIVNQGRFFPETHENVFDRLTMLIQQANGESKGAIRVAVGDPEPTRLVPALSRANLLLGFDSSGNPITVAPASGSAADLATNLANTADVAKGAGQIGRNDQIVNSITELRALLKTSASKFAFVNGYYAAGDGGGGQYYLDAADTTSVDNGGAIIVATDGGRWKLVFSGAVSARQFGAKGDGIADDTSFVQAALNWIGTKLVTVLETVGAVTDITSGTLPILDLGNGRYKLTAALTPPNYLWMRGNNAGLVQATVGADILFGSGAYQWNIYGLNFVGGRNQISIGNSNVDGTLYDVSHCEFHLSSDYAIKTFVTGGVFTHMSANLTIRKCHFSRPRKMLNNVCDSAIIEDTWVHVAKNNFDVSTAAILNQAPSGHPRLFLKNFFGVPDMGTQGVDRLASVRWVDNYGSVIANGCRFGGEFAGMPIVNHFAVPPTVAPFIGYEVVIRDSWVYGGPSAANDSCVVALQGQIPQRICIEDCTGPSDIPFVINPGGTAVNFSTYFVNYETATSRKAYNKFSVKINNNITEGPEGVIYTARIPAGLRPYVWGAKQTQVKRVAAQTITNGFVNNQVSFDTLVSDNMGGWAVANPTRLVIPLGATKMRITAYVKIAAHATSEIIAIRILDSGSTIQAGVSAVDSVSTDDNAYSVTADVSGVGGDFFTVSVLTNAAANLSLAACTVTLVPLDFVG